MRANREVVAGTLGDGAAAHRRRAGKAHAHIAVGFVHIDRAEGRPTAAEGGTAQRDDRILGARAIIGADGDASIDVGQQVNGDTASKSILQRAVGLQGHAILTEIRVGQFGVQRRVSQCGGSGRNTLGRHRFTAVEIRHTTGHGNKRVFGLDGLTVGRMRVYVT